MRQNVWKFHSFCLTLQRVFHSIRFKVNKVGVQRYSFFLCLEVKLLVAFFKTISTFMEVHQQIVVGHGSIKRQEKKHYSDPTFNGCAP